MPPPNITISTGSMNSSTPPKPPLSSGTGVPPSVTKTSTTPNVQIAQAPTVQLSGVQIPSVQPVVCQPSIPQQFSDPSAQMPSTPSSLPQISHNPSQETQVGSFLRIGNMIIFIVDAVINYENMGHFIRKN